MPVVVNAQVAQLDNEDFTWLVGRSIEDVSFAEPESWWFQFSGGGGCATHGGSWRVLETKSMLACSADHGHQFGMRSPFDALETARKALLGAVVTRARVRPSAPDLVVTFDNGRTLELLALSRGYECWETRDPSGRCLTTLGSRSASTWNEAEAPR